MTKYQINPDPDLWDGVKELKPDQCNLDDFVEGVLARQLTLHEEQIDDEYVEAAHRVLERSTLGVEP